MTWAYFVMGVKLTLEIVFSSHCRYWHVKMDDTIIPRCDVPRWGDRNKAWEFIDGWHPMAYGQPICTRKCPPDDD